MSIPVILEERLAPSDPFHPGEPLQGNWQAGNAAASQLLGLRTLWTNLITYIEISKATEGLASKLQLKAAICELKTLVDAIPALHACIRTHPKFTGDGLRPTISLSAEELDKEGEAYREFNLAKKLVESKLNGLRISIGAHFVDPQVLAVNQSKPRRVRVGTREKMTWEQITNCWESLTLKTFRELIEMVERYVATASECPIYEWYRFEPDGTLRTHLPLVGTINDDGTMEVQMCGSEFMRKMNLSLASLR